MASLKNVKDTIDTHKREELRQPTVSLAERYYELSAQKKLIEKEMEEIKGLLKPQVMEVGEQDAKGSYIIRQGDLQIKAERRITMKLKKDALEVMEERHPELIDEVTKRTIDDDAVVTAFHDGKLTDDDLEALSDRKESFALFVEQLDENGKTVREKNFGKKD